VLFGTFRFIFTSLRFVFFAHTNIYVFFWRLLVLKLEQLFIFIVHNIDFLNLFVIVLIFYSTRSIYTRVQKCFVHIKIKLSQAQRKATEHAKIPPREHPSCLRECPLLLPLPATATRRRLFLPPLHLPAALSTNLPLLTIQMPEEMTRLDILISKMPQ
jgi:hypothetical protein